MTIDEGGQKQNILVISDHFTKFSQAIVTKDQTARAVAKALWDGFFLTYGFPAKIHSDRGRDFESKLVQELCKAAGVQKCRTTPYHPAGNPVERWNRTLISMLRSLTNEEKKTWRKHLRAAVHAYNSRIHEATGYSPYYLFFGRHPRLPIDLAFGVEVKTATSTKPSKYVEKLREELARAYTRAKEQMNRQADRNKLRYDRSAHAADLETGDRVLVRRVGHLMKSKIDDRWEDEVYIICSRKGELPVYSVRRESGDGPTRILHRNLLLPIGWVGLCDPEIPTPVAKPKMRTRETQRKCVDAAEADSDPEEELEIHVEVEPQRTLRVEAPSFVPAGRAADPGEVVEEESQDETGRQSEEAQDVEGNAELKRSETATVSERDETPHDERGESQADEQESLHSQADEQGGGGGGGGGALK